MNNESKFKWIALLPKDKRLCGFCDLPNRRCDRLGQTDLPPIESDLIVHSQDDQCPPTPNADGIKIQQECPGYHYEPVECV